MVSPPAPEPEPSLYRLVRSGDRSAPAGDGLRRLTGQIGALHWVGAGLGFDRRFDAAVERLSVRGRGAAISPGQARLVFGKALRLFVDPAAITLRLADALNDGARTRSIDGAFLDGGDWRAVTYPLADSRAHREMLDICRFRDGFRRSSRYRVLADRIRAGERVRRNGATLRDVDDLDTLYLRRLALVESLERNGPRSVRELARAHRRLGDAGRRRSALREMVERDIGVAVTAEGALVRHACGRHRFAACQGLGLARVPVEVRLVHAGWLANEARRLGLPPHRALGAVLREAEARCR